MTRRAGSGRGFLACGGRSRRATPAGLAARREWTRFVRLEAERLGVSWCYWDFGTDFGAFDPERDAWREPLRDALLGDGNPLAG